VVGAVFVSVAEILKIVCVEQRTNDVVSAPALRTIFSVNPDIFSVYVEWKIAIRARLNRYLVVYYPARGRRRMRLQFRRNDCAGEQSKKVSSVHIPHLVGSSRISRVSALGRTNLK
jgi:hypothetical protein